MIRTAVQRTVRESRKELICKSTCRIRMDYPRRTVHPKSAIIFWNGAEKAPEIGFYRGLLCLSFGACHSENLSERAAWLAVRG